jgi:primosomal protein N'
VLIEVIPLGGSIDNVGLTYFIQDELAKSIQPGCLVEVPFRNALDYALVTKVGVSYEEIENLRSIVRVVTSIPFLSSYQIQTIFDCSSYYFVHAHHILSLFLSKSLIRYLEKKDFSGLLPQKEEKRGQDGTIHFHHHGNSSSFFEKIRVSITEDTVVVFPDDFFIDAYLKFDPSISEKACIVPEKLTETKKYKAFCSVYNGEKNIII